MTYGVAGIGKTTFAAGAPKPIFIDLEGGLDGIDAHAFPLAKTFADVRRQLWSLFTDEHDYETVIIDSIDWMEKLIWQQAVVDAKSEKIKTVEDFGYGKGYIIALEYWQQIIDLLNQLRSEHGMTVILIAHAEVKRFDSPESEPYERYQPRLHKTASARMQEWCDVVLFANYKTFTTRSDVGFNKMVTRAIGSGERVLYTCEKPSHLAKNRFSLPPELPMSWEAFQNAAAAAARPKQPAAAAAAQ